jgi:hypothetical protein
LENVAKERDGSAAMAMDLVIFFVVTVNEDANQSKFKPII